MSSVVAEPSGFSVVTSMVNSRSSSSSAQSEISGVPEIVPVSLSWFNPSGSSPTVTVDPSPGVMTISSIASSSLTVWSSLVISDPSISSTGTRGVSSSTFSQTAVKITD